MLVGDNQLFLWTRMVKLKLGGETVFSFLLLMRPSCESQEDSGVLDDMVEIKRPYGLLLAAYNLKSLGRVLRGEK